MAASETRIPLSYLPQLAYAANLWTLLGWKRPLTQIALDVKRSTNESIPWIQSVCFALEALNLQLVGILYRNIVNISDGRKLNRDFVTELFEVIYYNQILILSGRVVMCVFLGVLLNSVVCSRKSNKLSDILALTIKVVTMLIHISYEIYIAVIKNWIHNRVFQWDPRTVWLLVPNIIIFCSIVLLLLFLYSAALASKSIQDVVDHGISVTLSPAQCHAYELVDLLERAREEVVLSWIRTQTYQPDYIIARSVLSSSVGFLVTACVSVYIAVCVKNGYINRNDELELYGYYALPLQYAFILFGLVIVLGRWLNAVVYYPRFMGKKGLVFSEYFRVEDFWKRALLDFQEEFREWDVESIEKLDFWKRYLYSFVHKTWLYKLLPIFLYLQILLIRFSKTCWLISENIFSNCCMWRLVMRRTYRDELLALCNLVDSEMGGPGNPDDGGVRGPENHDDPGGGRPGNTGDGGLGSGSSIHEDFQKYGKVVMHMLGENVAAVWMANKESINKMAAELQKGESHGKESKILISLLKGRTMEAFGTADLSAISSRRTLQVEQDFHFQKGSVKMTVVSLLTIMMELSTLSKINGGSSNRVLTDTCIDTCINASRGAWGIMGFVEISDPNGSVLSKHTDRLFRSLEKPSRTWLGQVFPISKPEDITVLSAKRAIQRLSDKGREMADCGRIRPTGYDSNNWKTVMAGNSLYKVCENIKYRSDDVGEMLKVLRISLANVIWNCMIKVPRIIMDECTSWEEAFMDAKLRRALYIVGMAQGIQQSLQDQPDM